MSKARDEFYENVDIVNMDNMSDVIMLISSSAIYIAELEQQKAELIEFITNVNLYESQDSKRKLLLKRMA